MTPLLQVNDLEVTFTTDTEKIPSIDKISFHVNPGEILCLVGESGSGKSVTSLAVMGLLDRSGKITNGTIAFGGESLLEKSEKDLDRIRGNELTMIFQDSMMSLNPVFTIGTQITEIIKTHMKLNKRLANERAISLLNKVGLANPAAIMKKYPHTLSGGMRQRVMIAMALACNPKLLIADEPTTALDVTIQAQIMSLLRSLNKELGMAVILITHDFGLAAEMADRVMVMYAGQIIEEASVERLFETPEHPYTQALLKSIPSIRDNNDRELIPVTGVIPEHYHRITGCRFANRCPYVIPDCNQKQPMTETEKGHFKRCLLSADLARTGSQNRQEE